MVTSVECLALLAWLMGKCSGQSLTEYKGYAAREYTNEILGNYFRIVWSLRVEYTGDTATWISRVRSWTI